MQLKLSMITTSDSIDLRLDAMAELAIIKEEFGY
jgi:hypothetical protein